MPHFEERVGGAQLRLVGGVVLWRDLLGREVGDQGRLVWSRYASEQGRSVAPADQGRAYDFTLGVREESLGDDVGAACCGATGSQA